MECPGCPTEKAKDPPLIITQLVISSAIGISCFLYFCIVRTKWPCIYAPRSKLKGRPDPTISNSFFGWILPLLKIPETQILGTIGLDAAMILIFFKMVIKLFTILIIIGLPFLLPIKPYAPDDPDNDGNDHNSKTLMSFSFEFITGRKSHYSSDPTSNPYLIAHLIFTYLFTFITALFLYVGFRDFILIRRVYFLELSQNLASRTVMIQHIPKDLQSEQALAMYYEDLGIGTVESAFISRHSEVLDELLHERYKILLALESAWTKYLGNPVISAQYDPEVLLNSDNQRLEASITSSRPRPKIRLGGWWGKKVDEIDYFQNRFFEIDDKVENSRIKMHFKRSSTGFITFEDMSSAQIAAQILIHPTPGACITDLAPEVRDVYWPNINLSSKNIFIRKNIVNVILLLITFFWASPVAFIASFLDIRTLRKILPGLAKLAEENEIAGAIITGFLPTVVVLSFVGVLPTVMEGLSRLEGLKARSLIEQATMKKYFFFLYVFIILVFALIPGLGNTFWAIVGDPSSIASRLAIALRKLSKHYSDLIIYQGFAMYPLQLVQAGSLFLKSISRAFAKTPRDYAEINAPPTINIGFLYPFPIVIFCICITYSIISPTILIFGLFYFSFGYLVLKYQFIFVYFKPYESLGDAWFITFRMMVIGLLTFQVFMTGLFSLQKAFYLSGACTILIMLTIWWTWRILELFEKSSKYIPVKAIKDLGRVPLNGKGARSEGTRLEGTRLEGTRLEGTRLEGTRSEGTRSEGTRLEGTRLEGTRLEGTRLEGTRLEGTRLEGPRSTLMPTGTVTSRIGGRRGIGAMRLVTTLTGEVGFNLPDIITRTTSGISPPTNIQYRNEYYDDELYNIEGDKKTDYSQPFMRSFNYYPGVLSTGVRRYGHPALIGDLPEPWLPIKIGNERERLEESGQNGQNRGKNRRRKSIRSRRKMRRKMKVVENENENEDEDETSRSYVKVHVEGESNQGLLIRELNPHASPEIKKSVERKNEDILRDAETKKRLSVLNQGETSINQTRSLEDLGLSDEIFETEGEVNVLFSEVEGDELDGDEQDGDEQDEEEEENEQDIAPQHRQYFHHPERRSIY